MPWYAAKLILYTEFTDGGPQDVYPVWENVALIRAESPDEAFACADRKGAAEAQVSEGYTYDGRAARWVFAGVRRLTELIETFEPDEQTAGGAEECGTEVAWSSFLVQTQDDLRKLVSNEAVTVVYEGRNS